MGSWFAATRRYLDENPRVALGVAVGVFVVAMVIIVFQLMGGGYRGPSPVWYYDLKTGERFESDPGLYPPIDAPSGPGQGVRLFVYGCGGCEPSQERGGYLQRLTPEGKQAALAREAEENADARDRYSDIVSKSYEVRRLEGGNWFPADSPEAAAIVTEAESPCPDGQMPVDCGPGGVASVDLDL